MTGINDPPRPALIVGLLCMLLIGFPSAGFAHDAEAWMSLIAQADALGLPTRFLKVMPSDFITLEFEELHAFAAEYHPEEHRMLLNLSLSFNHAGGTLRPLAQLPHSELGTLYHELFHAYMDYLGSGSDAADPIDARLLRFARDRQHCQYEIVSITPLVQKKTVTEPRFLSEGESWEALNETWGVFVGWTVWTKLELARGSKPATAKRAAWLTRLRKADRDSDLRGYYEPQDPAERAIARKRYLAPVSRLTPPEAAILLEIVLGESRQDAAQSAAVMEQSRRPVKDSPPCSG